MGWQRGTVHVDLQLVREQPLGDDAVYEASKADFSARSVTTLSLLQK